MTALTNSRESDGRPKLSDYYIWEDDERPITVQLNYNSIERLQVEALSALERSSSRSIEISGILLGRQEKDGDRIATFVEDFILVRSSKKSAFSEALKQYKSEKQEQSVVGYFRSHVRDGLFLS